MEEIDLTKKFRVLSLDGGGVRGYLTALILENIEQQLGKGPLGQHFDLIVGTSTGAIIASMLAIGKSATEIRKAYEDDIIDIFSQKMKRSYLKKIWNPEYRSDELIKKSKEYFTNNVTDAPYTLNDVTTHLIVTSVDLLAAQARLHKSVFAERNKERAHEHLAKVVKASTSAPTYFEVSNDLNKSAYLIDGGIAANNPSMIALLGALEFEVLSLRGTTPPSSFDDISLLSIGTGRSTQASYDVDKLSGGGWKQWGKPISEVLMGTQEKLAEYQTKFLLDKSEGSYYRINPELAARIELDDASQLDKLKNNASLDAAQHEFINKYFK